MRLDDSDVELRVPGSKWRLIPEALRNELELYQIRDVQGTYVLTVPERLAERFRLAAQELAEKATK